MLNIPEQGKNYRVVKYDTLRKIATQVYGNEMEWPRIHKANPFITNPDLIYPDTDLFIPPEEEKIEQKAAIDEAKVTNKTVSVFLDGKEYFSKSGRFGWALDTIASSFNADFVWNPEKNPAFDKSTARGSFADSKLYLLGKLVCTGRLYARTNHIAPNEITKNLVCYSLTKDIVDTSLSPKFTEINNSTIKQITEEICGVLGFRTQFLDPPGPAFEYIQNPENETVGKYLQRLAAQRGLFISCDNTGTLVFQKLKTDGSPVAHIDLTGRIATGYQITYDDTQRFASYVATMKQADGVHARSGGLADPGVPGARQLVFAADDTAGGDLDKAAEWTMLKINLQAAELKLPVSTWTDSRGELWTPNTLITIKAPVLDIPTTRKMVIRGAEFEWAADSKTATLSLIPILKTDGGKLIMEDA